MELAGAQRLSCGQYMSIKILAITRHFCN